MKAEKSLTLSECVCVCVCVCDGGVIYLYAGLAFVAAMRAATAAAGSWSQWGGARKCNFSQKYKKMCVFFSSSHFSLDC